MVKRKAAEVDTETSRDSTVRRSTRRKSSAPVAPEPANESSTKPKPTKAANKGRTAKPKADTAASKTEDAPEKPTKPAKAAKPSAKVSTAPANGTAGAAASSSSDKQYWLLKAEPDSRFENGVDVKFSIDDLKSRTEPEPWDGIRAYAARNNLRSMKKGDLAFFYHSNCKEPALVGTMEIVREHSPDLSAHDPKAPYYDASSKPEDPKWSVVHVVFRSKFAQPIGLKELREMGKPGQPLENMQMLKQSRLSVSRVGASEWEYLMGVVAERGGETQ